MKAAWLFNGVRDAVERDVEVRPGQLHSSYDDDRDAGRNQAVLDGRRAGLDRT